MTSAYEFHAEPEHRKQVEPQDPADILQQLKSLVDEYETSLRRSTIVDELGTIPDELRRRLKAAKRKEANDRLYGPFLTTERALRQLNLKNRQALNGRLERNTILRVKTADGRNAYPALQFESDQVIPALKPVLQTLLPHVAAGWTVLDWLVHPHPALDGTRPIDRLRTDNTDAVMSAAREDASAWSA